MIRGGAGQDIDAVHVERFADILENLGPLALQFGHLIRSFAADFFVDVDDRANDGPRIFVEAADMFSATTVDAGDTDTELLVGTLGSRVSGGSGSDRRGGHSGELATIQFGHGTKARIDGREIFGGRVTSPSIMTHRNADCSQLKAAAEIMLDRAVGDAAE